LLLKDNVLRFKEMKGWLKKYLAGLLILFATLAWSQSPSKPDKEKLKLEKGAILVKSEKDSTTNDHISVGKALVRAPIELIWQVLTDYSAYPQVFSQIKTAEIVKKEKNKIQLKLVFKNIFWFSDFTSLVEYVDKGKNELEFHQIQGDFKKLYGRWKLSCLEPTKILVEYRFYRYVDWWWLPFIPTSTINNSIVYDQLSSLRKQVQKLQLKNGSSPEEVIPPKWRKSSYKEIEKKRSEKKKKKKSTQKKE